MARRRQRVNSEWETPEGDGFRWEHVQIEVLMDIREELRRLNLLLHCQNFQNIPSKLEAIRRKLPTPRKRAKP